MTSTAELIAAKRDGHPLTSEEIDAFLGGAVDGSIPDYQITAMLMAIYFRGMEADELATFTSAMVASGESLSISADRPLVDKHSTGGVGDKVSLPLAPLMAACGLGVPMMSGRGLGHTGGTLDKLESIPGFRTAFSPAEFAAIVESTGCIIAGQSDDIVPADRVLYRLRDTTATVASIPLIASSIMSKKLAEGLDALVLDIKVGLGAFMKTDAEARELARTMIGIGSSHGVQTRVLLTAMDQPLGREVGNANEVAESISVLRGEGPNDLTDLVHAIGAEMLDAAGVGDGAARISEAIDTGIALERFAAMVEAQSGDPRVVEDPDLLPQPADRLLVTSKRAGVVTGLDALTVGLAGVDLGAGRATADSTIDPAAGIRLLAKVGDEVEEGGHLALLGAADLDKLGRAAARLLEAYEIGEAAPSPSDLIRERLQ